MSSLTVLRNPARPRTWLSLAIVAAALLPAACGQEAETVEPEIRPVRVVTVEKREAGEQISLAGIVESQIQVDLAFRIGGRMIERAVNVGDTVKAGQLIARLDRTDEENSLRAAEAGLSAAMGQLSEARINYERQRHLYERKIAARVAFEKPRCPMGANFASSTSRRASSAVLHIVT